MGIQVILTYNLDRITNTELKVTGIPGDSCLLLTRSLRDLNPNAVITPTAEMDEEDYDVEQLNLLSEDG